MDLNRVISCGTNAYVTITTAWFFWAQRCTLCVSKSWWIWRIFIHAGVCRWHFYPRNIIWGYKIYFWSSEELVWWEVLQFFEWFLGLKIKWARSSWGPIAVLLALKTTIYIQSFSQLRVENCESGSTPMTVLFWKGLVAEEDKSAFEVIIYQQIIGALLFLALWTRLDILPAGLILARFQAAPPMHCHEAAERITGFLKGKNWVVFLHCWQPRH